jgi:hypothetical protein
MEASRPLETPLSAYQSKRCHIPEQPNLQQPRFTSHFILYTISPIKLSIHCIVSNFFKLHIFSFKRTYFDIRFCVLNVSSDTPFRRRSWTDRYWLLGETMFDLVSWCLQTLYLSYAGTKATLTAGRVGHPSDRRSWKGEAPVNYASSCATSDAVSYTSDSPCSYLLQTAQHPCLQ